MINLRVDFKTFMEDENETTYELTYKRETYLIFVKHDGKFHNKLWECEKEIPSELEWFLHDVITKELEKWKQSDDSIWKILRKERLKKVNDMSKWREIRCDFFNEEEEKYYVDAWKTGNDNEEGKVIAKIDLANGTVEYLDEDARTDEDAQVVINEFLENGYVLTEQSLNNDFNRKMEEENYEIF